MKTFTLAALIVAPVFSTAFLDSNPLSVVRKAIENDARTPYTCIREWTAWGAKETVRVRRDHSGRGDWPSLPGAHDLLVTRTDQ